MNNTKIEWCDSTWKPVTGCLHGCEYCYARKMANRFGGAFWSEKVGNIDVPCGTESDGKNHILDLPIKDECRNKQKTAPYPFWFDPTLHKYRLDEPQRWKKPRTIFVCSMADLFGEWVPDEWIEDVFAACKEAPQHTYLFLTKNPIRYLDLADEGKLPQSNNMWYGSSVTGEGIQHFSSSGKYNTFLSIEPLLFSINMRVGSFQNAKWIVIGAETGNRKNKVVPQKEWINHIITYCDETGIPVFMKDSVNPIIGEENIRREFPWDR